MSVSLLMILLALFALTLLALIAGLFLGFAEARYHPEEGSLSDEINKLLPQTQCGQCGHPGCKPYAEAIAEGAAINKCPPGGQATIDELARLLDVEALPLDAEHGEEAPPKVAVIREDECIGCTKCIQACPVDAILGAARQMHTVIEAECTGCDLCVAPCPVDCIDMVEITPSLNQWFFKAPKADLIATDRRGAL